MCTRYPIINRVSELKVHIELTRFVQPEKIEIDANERAVNEKSQYCFFVCTTFDSFLNDLLLNFVFKLYHKTCEQFYRNFGLYEKSPNSFLPGLPRSIINQFRFHNFLCLCLASVHLPHPFHLVFSFQLLGHAVLLCQ